MVPDKVSSLLPLRKEILEVGGSGRSESGSDSSSAELLSGVSVAAGVGVVGLVEVGLGVAGGLFCGALEGDADAPFAGVCWATCCRGQKTYSIPIVAPRASVRMT